MIQFKLLNEKAQAPQRAKTNSAGFDMYAPERVCIPAGKSYWVKSGVAMAIPHGYVGVLQARSSHAFNYGISILGGVIDSDYRGEVQIGLINHGTETLEICAGDRICQMLVHQYLGSSTIVDELPEDVDRGIQGFGSTGH